LIKICLIISDQSSPTGWAPAEDDKEKTMTLNFKSDVTIMSFSIRPNNVDELQVHCHPEYAGVKWIPMKYNSKPVRINIMCSLAMYSPLPVG
jgi:hypothetical protein